MKPSLALPASLALLLAAAACGNTVRVAGTTSGTVTTGTGGIGTTTTGGAGCGADGCGAGPASDVNGSVVDHYYDGSGMVTVPVDLTGLQVEALVADIGTWTTYPGSGKADGTFNIPAVPEGWFMLDVAGTYVYTQAHTLDLGSDISGRPTAVQSMGTTQITGNLSGLIPWQPSDVIEWFDGGGGGGAYTFTGPEPMGGDTVLAGQPSTWLGALVDGNQGDTLYATQLTTTPVPGATAYSIARFASFPAVLQQNGALTTVTGGFAPANAPQQIAFDFRGSEFAQLTSAVSPGAKSYSIVIDLATLPGAASVGFAGYTADLFLAYPGGNADVKIGPVSYANPFPSSWGTSVYAGETWSKDYTAPGATAAATQYGSVYLTLPVAQAAAGPIQPTVTPVQSLTVNGLDASGPMTGVSTTPSLSWSPPPVTSQATGYRVVVYEVAAAGGATSINYLTEIATTYTSIVVPPNLLQMGHAYTFTVTAVSSPNNLDSAPFRGSAVFASADTLTGLLQP